MSEKQEIKNCKCGNKPGVVHASMLDSNLKQWKIECAVCGTWTGPFATEDLAVGYWNKIMEPPVPLGKEEDTLVLSKCSCGKIPVVRKYASGQFAIVCLKKDGGCGEYTLTYDTEERAIKVWNDCHPLSQKNVKGVGKVNMNLLMVDMAEAVREVCEVMTHGAVKHTPAGWRTVPNGVFEYTNSLHRHLNQEACGEVIDPEFGKHHAAHAACSALIRLQLIIDAEKKEVGK